MCRMKLYKPIDGLIDSGSVSRRRRGLLIGVSVLLAVCFLVYVAVDSDEAETGNAPVPETPMAQEALAGLGTEQPVQPTAHPAAPSPFGAPSGSTAVEVAPKTAKLPAPAVEPAAPKSPKVQEALTAEGLLKAS